MNTNNSKAALVITASIGLAVFAVILAYHNIADGDLWARLVQGGSIWYNHSLVHKDMFAFTDVLPELIDHEWGAGLIFFSLLKIFGPASLIIFKICMAIGALIAALAVGRRNKSAWPVLFLLMIPCALTIFPGFIPVVRSHTITYFCFSVTLFCLELVLSGRRWPAAAVVLVMLIWANCHGGFVAGLGLIALYAFVSVAAGKRSALLLGTLLASILVTFINPYGAKLWDYLVPALLLPRAHIPEWHAMEIFAFDSYFGFRALVVIAAAAIVLAMSRREKRGPIQGFLILLITAYMAFRHQRHAPFFGLACAAFLGTYIEAAALRIPEALQRSFKEKIKPMSAVLVIYVLIALPVASLILPEVSFFVLAPAGFYPVRETDVLMSARARGNVLVPLRWGNYVMWRLYPDIKISMCGRYEAMYPEYVFDMNYDFFAKKGKDWDRILKRYKVDYIMMDLKFTRLLPGDLAKLGFDIVGSNGTSALYARERLAPYLRAAGSRLPSRTVQPLDARIPLRWWQKIKK